MAAKSDPTDALVVLDSFIGSINGEERLFRAGELVRPSDPAVKKWPAKFGPALYRSEPRIEQATAAPGEKRA